MDSPRMKRLFVVLLIMVFAFSLSACDMNDNGNGNGLQIEFDETYSEADDYFQFDYPNEWEIAREYIVDNYIDVEIVDEDGEEANHLFWVHYIIDNEWDYREDETEFYNELEGIEEDIFIEVDSIRETEFKNNPALEIKGIIEEQQETYEVSYLFVLENNHQHIIAYVAKEGEYSDNIASTFFDSFEFTN